MNSKAWRRTTGTTSNKVRRQNIGQGAKGKEKTMKCKEKKI